MKDLEELRDEKDRTMLIAEAALSAWREAAHLKQPTGGKRGRFYRVRKEYVLARNAYLSALGRELSDKTEELLS